MKEINQEKNSNCLKHAQSTETGENEILEFNESFGLKRMQKTVKKLIDQVDLADFYSMDKNIQTCSEVIDEDVILSIKSKLVQQSDENSNEDVGNESKELFQKLSHAQQNVSFCFISKEFFRRDIFLLSFTACIFIIISHGFSCTNKNKKFSTIIYYLIKVSPQFCIFIIEFYFTNFSYVNLITSLPLKSSI